MANLLANFGEDTKVTFNDITKHVETRSDKVIVQINDKEKNYAISIRRLNKSAKSDDTELYVSTDGKWLIPADTVAQQQEADW